MIMKASAVLVAFALSLGIATSALGQTAGDRLKAPAAASDKICESVVNADVGATAYKLCLTKDEWSARKLVESKDANRVVCHYEEYPGTRFRSSKVCMPASQWEDQRMQERQTVEQIQKQPCVAGGGC